MPDPGHIRLSELTSKIANSINSVFNSQTFWVVADVTDHKYYSDKGHHYFSLTEKDPGSNNIIAKISSVAWGQGSEKIRAFERITGQVFKNDINVLIKLSVSYHQLYGLKTTLLEIDSNFTIGQLEKQRLEILQKLLLEFPNFITKVGDRFITANSKLSLRPVIQRIAVISSLNSAGFQDFQHTLDTNPLNYAFKTDTYYASVQGLENAKDIYQRFNEVIESKKNYDVVVVIRGGGSQTDFMIFDTFILGEIVARFPIPVITGIGHQKNETIVDLMAHTPLKTPTKAAEFIIAHNRTFEESVHTLQKVIIIKSQQVITRYSQLVNYYNTNILNLTRSRISRYKDELVQFNQATVNKSKEILLNNRGALIWISNQVVSKPKLIISNKRNSLLNEIENLKIFNRKYFTNFSGYIGHFISVMKLMSPENILRKGFAIVYQNGKISNNPRTINVGSEISVVFSETELLTTVKEKKQRDGSEFNL